MNEKNNWRVVMVLSLTIALAILGVTTGIAVTVRKNVFFIAGAIVSLFLILCFVLWEPTQILLPNSTGTDGLTVDNLEVLLTIITVFIEVGGFYQLHSDHHK